MFSELRKSPGQQQVPSGEKKKKKNLPRLRAPESSDLGRSATGPLTAATSTGVCRPRHAAPAMSSGNIYSD